MLEQTALIAHNASFDMRTHTHTHWGLGFGVEGLGFRL